jgi:sugar phosphate isomerase/epimerase
VAVHFTLDAGNAVLGEENWESVGHLAEITGTPYINLHLDTQREYFQGLPIDTTDPADIKRLLSVMISDVLHVVEHFGSDRVIIENSPYRGETGNTLRPCVEPDLISRVVEETGCGFLLDIAHAFISAHYLGMNQLEYFSRLPVHQLKEMHFTGIHTLDGQLMDHLSISEIDWRRLDWVLTRILSGEWSQPWMLAFEYGGVGAEFEWRSSPQVIADQVPRLLEKLRLLWS